MTGRRLPRNRKKTLFQRIRAVYRKVGTLNIILVFVFGIFLWFNGRMLDIYEAQGQIPETYACAVVASLIGECGICGWIRTNKDRRREHKWEKEDKLQNQEMEENK